MSQALKQLLNKPSLHSRIATLFHHHQSPVQFPFPPAGALSNSRFTPNSNPFPISKADDKNKITDFNGFQAVYPSFSFGYFLNHISPSGLLPQFEAAEVVADGGDESKTMIWADSVKKKRKRKMNKHKLKKMRKSLRHCT